MRYARARRAARTPATAATARPTTVQRPRYAGRKTTRCAPSITLTTSPPVAPAIRATSAKAAAAARRSLRLDSRRTEPTSPLMRYAISIDWDCFTADLAGPA
jgi:hypothetical protein